MTNNKQSSVDVILNLLVEKGYAGLLDEDEIGQVRAIHKAEIEDAHGEEQSKLQDDGSWKRQTSEQYYSETFGSNNEQQ